MKKEMHGMKIQAQRAVLKLKTIKLKNKVKLHEERSQIAEHCRFEMERMKIRDMESVSLRENLMNHPRNEL